MTRYVIMYPGSARTVPAGAHFPDACRFAVSEAGILRSDVLLTRTAGDNDSLARPIYRVSPNATLRSLTNNPED